MLNSTKLKARMVECGLKQSDIAQALNIQQSTINLKLNNKRAFTLEEAGKLQNILQIPDADFAVYFFDGELRNATNIK